MRKTLLSGLLLTFMILTVKAENIYEGDRYSEDDIKSRESIELQDTLKSYYLDEFVVTSSVKETNRLEKIPTAVSVVTPRLLENARIESLPNLSSFIPNLFIPSYGSKVSTPIYIRGIGARLGSQTVSLYVDNVPSFNPSAYDFEFQDIQRVEVLRGAQGTLYGRNAVGGIINIYTLSPLRYQGTRMKVSGGNYGQFMIMGSNYSKLSDNFGMSTSAYYKRDDGYFKNNFTDKKVDDSKNAGGKVKFEWQASPDFKAMLFANYDYVDGGAFPYMRIDSETSNFNEPSSYSRHLVTNGLSLDWQRGNYSIHSTTGFQYLKDDMKMDQDYTSNSVFSLNQKQKEYSLSQEFTIKSSQDRKYSWVWGLFGFYDHREIDTPVSIKEDGVNFIQGHLDRGIQMMHLPIKLQFANQRIDLPGVYTKPAKGIALFNQSTINNLFDVERLSLTFGARLDYESTSIDYDTESVGGDVNLSLNLPGVPVPPMPPILVESDTVLTGSLNRDFWQFLPKIAFRYEYSPTSMIYLSASKGYKTGGYNEQMFSDILQGALTQSIIRNSMKLMPKGVGGAKPPMIGKDNGQAVSLEEQLSYDPETSWTYELGGRYAMLDNRMSLSYAFFYSRVNDIQIIKLAKQGTSGRMVENAGKSDTKGFELSIKYQPITNLSLYGDYGFADARFVKYEASEEVDYSGTHIPFAPRNTVTLGASYVYNFGNNSFLDRITTNIQYSGVGKIYWTESNKDVNGEDLYQKFYGLVNGSVSLEKGPVMLEFWGKNIFDKKYNSFLFEVNDLMTGNTNSYVQRGYPVRFGASLKMVFDR
ncbi:MAG: TonB-dependent receptor [Fermentimonas sp.]|jgi:iron complex outermembrane receptor protein